MSNTLRISTPSLPTAARGQAGGFQQVGGTTGCMSTGVQQDTGGKPVCRGKPPPSRAGFDVIWQQFLPGVLGWERAHGRQERSTDTEDKESQLFLYSHECHDTGGGYQDRKELK